MEDNRKMVQVSLLGLAIMRLGAIELGKRETINWLSLLFRPEQASKSRTTNA